ncbi:MAG: adenylate/guanylate cyclase domain-containing protein [Spirochaetia bacterium]|nr:adenylate/guanylate cyclase domain-containing protein [Spirochaetia bacterium]
MPRIQFQNDTTVDDAPVGKSLLDVSLGAGIQHTHVCGGNARCSTCRVIVLDGAENLAPRTQSETELARRKGLPEEVRLACQTLVQGDAVVRRLVIDEEDVRDILSGAGKTAGREAELAVLFMDVRGFSTFAEEQLPYDVVHILNRLLSRMGESVIKNGGFIDKYMGDGLMALFGLEGLGDAGVSCLSAVRAGLDMVAGLASVNDYTSKSFHLEFRIGVGVHFGNVVLGEVGHPHKMQFTALGHTVNMAKRVESATKSAGVPFLISEPVRAQIASRITVGRRYTGHLKGRTAPARLFEVLGSE